MQHNGGECGKKEVMKEEGIAGDNDTGKALLSGMHQVNTVFQTITEAKLKQ